MPQMQPQHTISSAQTELLTIRFSASRGLNEQRLFAFFKAIGLPLAWPNVLRALWEQQAAPAKLWDTQEPPQGADRVCFVWHGDWLSVQGLDATFFVRVDKSESVALDYGQNEFTYLSVLCMFADGSQNEITRMLSAAVNTFPHIPGLEVTLPLCYFTLSGKMQRLMQLVSGRQ